LVTERDRVDFLVVGAQKAGTNAMRHYLSLHPSIGLHAAPEAHYFDSDQLFTSYPAYGEYHRCFPPASETLRRGEVTPIYMYWRPSMQRIWEYNPDIRLIALLRNPVERAYSHWNMERNRGLETLPFLAALRRERERLRAARPLQDRVHSYIDRGFYTEQIRRMWSYFEERQTLFIRSDLLSSEPRAQLRRVCEFLDIEDVYQHVDATRVFEGTYSAPIETPALDLLNDVFEGELASIEQMLSWDLASWRLQSGSRA
jgi:hypothetical protein